MCQFVTVNVGANNDGGPNQFAPTTINTLGARFGQFVDALIINGQRRGGEGGTLSPNVLELAHNNDYIDSINIRSGLCIDNIEFHTKNGLSLKGGGNGGNPTFGCSGIRLVTIGGHVWENVLSLQLTYVDGYQPSKIIAQHAQFIVGYTAPNTTIEIYESTTDVTTKSFEQVTNNQMSSSFSASIQAEYGAKVSAATNLTFSESTMTTIQNSLQETVQTFKKTTQKVGDGQVGIMVVSGTIMEGGDGKFWMFPENGNNFAIIPLTEWTNLLDHYDLTGTLSTQMGKLNEHRSEKNGFVYYQKSPVSELV